MRVFDPKECTEKPRADMCLPDYVKWFGVFLDVLAVALLIVAVSTKVWAFIILSVIFGGLGVAAYLCWKNQKIVIIDDKTFEYTTFLGKTMRYDFSEIKRLKPNSDSLTLFVGDGKVHIESCVNISAELLEKIDAALEANGEE
jgi:hypothetical protein